MNENKGTYHGTYKYKSGGEKRVVRSLTDLYRHKRICDFPTDPDTLHSIMLDIINSVHYCYKRTDDKGRIEYEMIDELNNIAFVVRGYQQIKDGNLTCGFNKELFEFLLLHGMNYDKGQIIRMLIKSRLLAMLSICIQNREKFTFSPKLLSGYYNDPDISLSDKNLLYMMTHRVCIPQKSDYELNIEKLTVDEMITGIKYGILDGSKEKLYGSIKEEVHLLGKDPDKEDDYKEIVSNIMILNDLGALPIEPFRESVKWHIMYKAKYTPETIDYAGMDLDILPLISSLNTAGNLKKNGGFLLYERVKERCKKDPGFAACTACETILNRYAEGNISGKETPLKVIE